MGSLDDRIVLELIEARSFVAGVVLLRDRTVAP
jgi:hypothetical protein